MEGSIETVKETINCEVVIVNRSGRSVQSTLPAGAEITLPGAAIETVLGGRKFSGRALLAQEQGNAYTIGVPIFIDGAVSGGVFVSTRMVRLGSEVGAIMPTFLLCGLAILLLAVVLLYFITRQITRPLYEMAIAARSYSRGDFSKRITVAPEGELRVLATTFNQMAENLGRLETTRREFIADVSHELRTPMTTIGGFIDGILDGVIPPEEEQKYLLLVSEETKRLSRMVNNLLDVAKIQSGEISYKMEPFDVSEAVGRVVLSVEERVRESGITLEHNLSDQPVYAIGDQDAIYRVIYNLVDNAVKFCNDGGRIDLGLYPKDGKVYFSVRNTGRGIPEQEVGKIFERFYKTDKSRGENRKGVGLGLYMVKSIIDAHGEDLYVSSQEGRFAEFTFTLKIGEQDGRKE
jgi:signal transduction histidine kinase